MSEPYEWTDLGIRLHLDGSMLWTRHDGSTFSQHEVVSPSIHRELARLAARDTLLEDAAETARAEFEGSFSLEYLEADQGWGWYAQSEGREGFDPNDWAAAVRRAGGGE